MNAVPRRTVTSLVAASHTGPRHTLNAKPRLAMPDLGAPCPMPCPECRAKTWLTMSYLPSLASAPRPASPCRGRPGHTRPEPPCHAVTGPASTRLSLPYLYRRAGPCQNMAGPAVPRMPRHACLGSPDPASSCQAKPEPPSLARPCRAFARHTKPGPYDRRVSPCRAAALAMPGHERLASPGLATPDLGKPERASPDCLASSCPASAGRGVKALPRTASPQRAQPCPVCLALPHQATPRLAGPSLVAP